jgi:hypothetical protein
MGEVSNMSLKIYLLRHGETEYSQRGTYCGILDAELTAEGHEMAQAFADAYRTIPWTAVYASPMKRAISTAQPLCDALSLPMQIRDGLREIGYGAWEDRELDYVRQHYEQDYIRWQTDPAWKSADRWRNRNSDSGSRAPCHYRNRVHAQGRQTCWWYPTRPRYASFSVACWVSTSAAIGDRINALAAAVSIVKFGAYGPMLEVLGDRSYMAEHLRKRSGDLMFARG